MDGMRDEARRLFGVALGAADPAAAVRRALSAGDLPGGAVRVLALGKAARAMAGAALAALGERVVEALVISHAGGAGALPGARVMVAGHPVPDGAGLRAGRAAESFLARAGAGEVVLVLVSGGGSALVPAPVAGLTLQDKAAATEAMLAGGLAIGEMNAVRQHLSRLKGGGMARLAAPAQVVALILSDVVGDDLRVVASGPTVAPVMARGAAVAMLRERGLWGAMPAPVRAALVQQVPAAPAAVAENRLIGGNGMALDAVAAAAPGAEVWSRALVGDVGAAADWLVGPIRAARAGPVLALCGGETTVTLRGAGKGGRNQELALRVAAGMAGVSRPWLFLSGGTDGRDGPTDAAGGLVDGGTLARIGAAGGDWRALLADNDSHRALGLAGDLLITGPTGTNVADIQIILMG